MEISEPAAAIARAALGEARIGLFDGVSLPLEDDSFELGILSHVLEHVPEPATLLGEAARVCRRVVFEVPLEANWSARRPSKRIHAGRDRPPAAVSTAPPRGGSPPSAGLQVAAELQDPLPLDVHRFFAAGRAGRARARLKWAARAALDGAAPALARRAFTVHYACLCRRPGE